MVNNNKMTQYNVGWNKKVYYILIKTTTSNMGNLNSNEISNTTVINI